MIAKIQKSLFDEPVQIMNFTRADLDESEETEEPGNEASEPKIAEQGQAVQQSEATSPA